MSNNNNVNVLLGLLAGAAIGATVGILFAPHKGSKTREKISKKGQAYKVGIEDKFHEIVEGIHHKIDGLKSEVADVAEAAKSKSNAIIDKAAGAARS